MLLFVCTSVFSQENIFYEQVAFDFYQSEILQKFPVKKKLKVYNWFRNFHPNYFVFHAPECLKGIVWKSNDQFQAIKSYEDKQSEFDSSFQVLDFSKIDKRKFKEAKSKDGSYFPKLKISLPFIERKKGDRVFINIYQLDTKLKSTIYLLEFDKNGKIVNWCREQFETIVTR